MKSRTKKITAITLSTLLITATGSAMAFGGYPDRSGNYPREKMTVPMRALSQLNNLTDEQKDRLKSIRKASRKAMRDIGNRMQDVRDDLRDSRSERESLDTIRALAEKQGDLVTRMIILRAETRDKTTNILTDAQQEQLTALSQPGNSLWRPYGKTRYGQPFSPRHKMHRGSRCRY